jgi:hypothetical protein
MRQQNAGRNIGDLVIVVDYHNRYLNLNSLLLAAGIGILAFRQRSGIAAFHKIVTRFYWLFSIPFQRF